MTRGPATAVVPGMLDVVSGPACDDAFVDALVGLDRLCSWLTGEIDRVMLAADPASPDEPTLLRPSDDDDDDDPLFAVLGLVSLRTTIALVLGALRGEPPEPSEPVEPAGSAPWSRELLR